MKMGMIREVSRPLHEERAGPPMGDFKWAREVVFKH